MKFLCTHTENKAHDDGLDINDRGHTNLKRIYDLVSKDLYEGLCKKKQRGTALKWSTIVNKLRKKMRDDEAAEKGNQEEGHDEDSYNTQDDNNR